MRTGKLRWAVSLAAMLALFTSTPRSALADNVIADDQIVQGALCVGPPCANGEVFPFAAFGELKVKGLAPHIVLQATSPLFDWRIEANSTNLVITDVTGGGTSPLVIFSGAPDNSIRIVEDGKVGVGGGPTQQLHVQKHQNANTFILVQNATNGLNANAVVRTQADTAIQNFQSHASSRTLVRWGVPLGGWNEFLAVQGSGLAMGTLGNAPFILGTSATRRMTFDGDSDRIFFAGGGEYDGNSFLDASSRALKQDIRPLGPDAAMEALVGLEPMTFAYTGASGDPRVGFIAEDVPDLVATPDRKTLSALEIVAVLTRVVKEQQRAAQEQQTVVREQQRAIAELTARLSALEARP
jgi:hypothetical protein